MSDYNESVDDMSVQNEQNNNTQENNCNQRQRGIMEPYDRSLLNSIPMRTTSISLERLKIQDIYFQLNLKNYHIDLQIMHIITPILNINASIK